MVLDTFKHKEAVARIFEIIITLRGNEIGLVKKFNKFLMILANFITDANAQTRRIAKKGLYKILTSGINVD